MRIFETYHPIVLLVFFVAVVSMTMFFMHPVYLLCTLIAAICFQLVLKKERLWKEMKFYVPLFLVMAIVNPLISHNGKRVLFYMNGNAITVEAIFYGIAMAMMIVAVMLWFSSYNDVMTSDKFLYLFGRISPALSLTLSITMRLVPRFTQQLKQIVNAQKSLGMDYSTGSLRHRLSCIVRILSVLITWALDNAIDTADSMKARGYGIKKRSTFSIFTFERKDTRLLVVLVVLIVLNGIAVVSGATVFYFYPTFSRVSFEWGQLLFYSSYLLLVMMPIIIEVLEALKWHKYKSKI